MTTRRRFLRSVIGRAAAGGVAVAAALTLLPAVTLALTLDEAKAAGWVGERPDGYVGLVRSDAPPGTRDLVNRINAERRANYAAIAARTGTTAEKVGLVAGQKLINATPRGQYVMTQSGQWVAK